MAPRVGFGHHDGSQLESKIRLRAHRLDPAGASGLRQPSGAPLFESYRNSKTKSTQRFRAGYLTFYAHRLEFGTI